MCHESGATTYLSIIVNNSSFETFTAKHGELENGLVPTPLQPKDHSLVSELTMMNVCQVMVAGGTHESI